MIAPKALKSTTIKTKQKLMYYLGAFIFMFVYTVMSYSIALFIIGKFPNNENAIFLVGIILAIANIIGLFLNGIWLYMQKTLKSKTLLLISIAGLLLSVFIFFGGSFFFNSLNAPAFVILAVFIYVWAFDISDITMTTIILNNSTKETEGAEFSQKKIAESIGMLAGIVVGGLLLLFGTATTQFFLGVFLVGIFIYFKQNFENQKDKDVILEFSDKNGIDWKEILKEIGNPEKIKKKLQISIEENQENNNKTNIKDINEIKKKTLEISNKVSSKIKDELKDLSKSGSKSAKKIAKTSGRFLNEARLLLLDILAKDNEVKRVVVPKHDFHIKEILTEISSSFSVLGKAFSLNTRYAFFWSCVMVMFFSFWDTMAITYQPLFLERFRESLDFWVAFIMPIFILPVFILQMPFGKLADKWGTHIMMMIGLFISAISLMIMGSLDAIFGGSITVLILAGVFNSIGYTAAFSASQVHFSGEVRYYLEKNKLKIKNSLLAASLRLSLNIGNIFGQLFGGLIFSLLGFLTGFFLLGLFLLILFIATLFFIKHLKIPELLKKLK